MLRGALATPTRSADAAGTLLIGGVLTLLGWVLVPVWLFALLTTPLALVATPLAFAPTFLTRGYLLRVLADGIETGNADGAPPFVGWGGLYRAGVKSALLSAAYLLPLVVFLVAALIAGALVEVDRVDPTAVVDPGVGGTDLLLGAGGGFVALVGVGYLVAFAYVRPAALAVFAATGRARDGLRPGVVLPVAGSGDYAVAWVLAAVALVTGYVVGAPLAVLLVGVVVVFAVRVVAHSLYGRGAATAVGATAAVGRAGEVDVGAGEVSTAADGDRRSSDGRDARNDAETEATRPPSRARRRLPEAPPAVQTGRSVPVAGPPGAASEREAGRTADESAGGVDDSTAEVGRDDSTAEVDHDDSTAEVDHDDSADDGFVVATVEDAGSPEEGAADDESDGDHGFSWGPTGEDR